MSMSDTTLPPRLQHLLLTEDRRTGQLLYPNLGEGSMRIAPTERSLSASSSSSIPMLSPPISPTYPPTMDKHQRPTIQLPERRTSHIFNLLNATTSPPNTSRSVSPTEQPSSVLSAPSSLPLTGASPSPPPPPTPFAPMSQPRPDFFRRHSSHPYDHTTYNPVSNGARAPISRTTKACNACRSRKVRCDAGGAMHGDPTTCGRCRESGVECVYSGIQKKRGPCPGTARPSISSSSGVTRRKSSQNLHQGSYAPYPSPPDRSMAYGYPYPYPYPSPHMPMGMPPPHHRPSMPEYIPPTFLPPAPKHSISEPIPVRKQSILSWPDMQPAVALPDHRDRDRAGLGLSEKGVGAMRDNNKKMFESEYSMQVDPMSGAAPSFFGDKGRSLPPLSMVVGRRASYYEP